MMLITGNIILFMGIFIMLLFLNFIIQIPPIIIDIIAALFYVILVYSVVSGFLYDVTLRRLTKVSFSLNQSGDIDLADFLDLLIAYFIGGSVFVFLYLYLPIQNSNTNLISKETFAIFGIVLLYAGRIITKMEGSFYGRLHFTSVLVSPFILILSNVISSLGGFKPLGSELDIYNIINIVSSIFYLWLDYIKLVLDTSQGTPIIMIMFLGSICLASIGEWYLSNLPNKVRSNLCVVDKFPSRFRSITNIKSDSGKTDFIKNNLFGEDEIIKLKCITKSLGLVKFAKESIEAQYNRCTNEANFKCQIILAPKGIALDNFEDAINELPYSFFSNKKFKIDLINDFGREYGENYEFLVKLLENTNIKAKDYDYCGVPFLITENKFGFKKLLFLIKDKGTIGNRVGLYTDDQYFIETIEKVFNSIWDISVEHKVSSGTKKPG